jgi:hypothetical protein
VSDTKSVASRTPSAIIVKHKEPEVDKENTPIKLVLKEDIKLDRRALDKLQ